MIKSEAIEIARAHMAEVDAARLRGEETAAEKALADAKQPIREYEPSSLPPAPSLQSATPRKGVRGKDRKPRKRRRAVNHDEAMDNAVAALRKREYLRVEDADHALRIYEQARRYGVGSEPPKPGPKGLFRSSPLVGESPQAQVVRMVEEAEGFREWRRSGGLEGTALRNALTLQLPQDFPYPWAGLCGVEREAVSADARIKAAGFDGFDAQVSEEQGDKRLLKGFRIAE